MDKKPIESLPPNVPAAISGPRRRAPMYYVGETYGRKKARTIEGATTFADGRRVTSPRSMQYPDVERNPNGSVPGIRNKFMRRLIRKAFKVHHSKIEKALKLPRAMLEQARLIAKENGHGSKWARRLFARELAIHQEAEQQPIRAQRRDHQRRLRRAGKKDAIAQLVERMSEERR